MTMDALLEEIKDGRGSSDKTLQNHRRYLNRISNVILGRDFDGDVSFFKTKYDDIIKYFESEGVTKSMVRGVSDAILVSLSPTGKDNIREGYEDVVKSYRKIIFKLHAEYTATITNNTRSEKDEKNWLTQKEVMDVYNDLKKAVKFNNITAKSETLDNVKMNILKEYMVLSLYLLFPPQRLNYTGMEIISKKNYDKLTDEERSTISYLVVTNAKKKEFSFGERTLKNKGGDTLVRVVPNNLNVVLNLWLKHNKTKWLIPSYNNSKEMDANALTKFINRIFEKTGKSVSVTLLRKIYKTYDEDTIKVDELNKKIKEKADVMNHSQTMADKVYKKAPTSVPYRFRSELFKSLAEEPK